MSYRALWQTLHDPTRLRILALLEEEELSVAELQGILHLGQSRISTHLAHLRHVGLVQPRRDRFRRAQARSRKTAHRGARLFQSRRGTAWQKFLSGSDLDRNRAAPGAP